MKVRFVLGLLFVFGAFSSTLFAAQFSCDWKGKKMKATLITSRPPDQLLLVPRPPDDDLFPVRDIKVEIVEAPMGFRHSDRIRGEVERLLATKDGFVINNENPEAIFRIYVTAYDRPDIKRYTENEKRSIKVGQDCTKDEKGKERCKDKYDYRIVPVRYWKADARINLRVEVVDNQKDKGFVLDRGFAPESTFSDKKETAVNGETKIGEADLPDENKINNNLITKVIAGFTHRYTRTNPKEEVELACDDELQPANKLVVDGLNNWESAFDAWESTKMKKKENEGDRIYNMAVAKEALAYETYEEKLDPSYAIPLFEEALSLYAQAMSLDPKEKYIQKARHRLEKAKANFKRAIEQWEEIRLGRESQIAKFNVEPKVGNDEKAAARAEAMKRPPSEDTSEEKEFRKNVRVRFSNIISSAEITDTEKNDRISYGAKLGLNDIMAERVIYQEIERKKNIEEYKREFEGYIADGILSEDEKDALAVSAKLYFMTNDDIEAVKLQYKSLFKDESVVNSPAPKAKESVAAKPKVAASKPAENKPAVTPATTADKPAVAAPKPKAVSGTTAPKN